jgi:transcriptional regulator with XRE-family HTH domain
MNIKTLEIIAKLKHLSQADIAKKAGISRQAVSLWFKEKKKIANVQSLHLQKLARELRLSVDDLLKPIPCLDNSEYARQLNATLLWDHLYPTIEDFAIALVENRPQALARLVEVYGLFSANALVGKVVWRRFPQYKKFLTPIRRKQCDHIWLLQRNLNLI